MKDIKIIVFDVGNTLVDSKAGKISFQMLKDLNELKKIGYKVGISTLRTEDMLVDLLNSFKFDFMILANGGIVKINDEIVLDNPLSKTIIDKIERLTSLNELELKKYISKDNCYALEVIRGKNKLELENKYNYYVWDISGNIDITSLNTSKEYGLKKVCERYNCGLDNVLAFGDGVNDFEMLKISGVSVVMDGAPNSLISIADFVTEKAKENGVSNALRRLKIL